MNQSGFSLVQIVVGSGIMSIVLLAMATVFSTQSKATSQFERKLDGINLSNVLNSALLRDEFCSCNFSSISLNSLTDKTLPNLKLTCNGTGNEIANVNQPVSSGSQLVVESIKLENIRSVGAGADYFMDLVVSFKEKENAISVKPIRMGFFGSVNASTKAIQSCRPQATTLIRDMCESMGGTYNSSNGRCTMPAPTVIARQPSPAPSSTTTSSPSSSDPCATASGLDATYCQTLGRMPDAEGKQFWMDQINSGRATMAEVQAAIANSAEATMLNAAKSTGAKIRTISEISSQIDTNVSEVDRSAANANMSRTTIAEYTRDTISGDPQAAAINQMYQDVAGRQADTAGAAWWLDKINKGEATMDDLKRGLEGEVSARPK